MDNMELYRAFEKTPDEAKKPIEAGRLKGFTDINPMWRFKRLTEVFGPVGIGWKFVITDKKTIPGSEGTVAAFVDILLYYKHNGAWSEGIPGTGGSSFVAKERNGLYTSDECFKMALSDAVGTACKALGMSADIYFSKDRSKYTAPPDIPTGRDMAEQARYDEAIRVAQELIAAVKDAESANAAAPYLKDIPHAMTSERDVNIMWNRHIKSLGLIYDRILKAYTPVG